MDNEEVIFESDKIGTIISRILGIIISIGLLGVSIILLSVNINVLRICGIYLFLLGIFMSLRIYRTEIIKITNHGIYRKNIFNKESFLEWSSIEMIRTIKRYSGTIILGDVNFFKSRIYFDIPCKIDFDDLLVKEINKKLTYSKNNLPSNFREY